jgi:spermidine/putrescine transport system ATP-binding protein
VFLLLNCRESFVKPFRRFMTPRAAGAVEIQNVTRRFGEVVALDRVSLSIAEGEFFSLLGPSGCGKTTLLRMIAGLDLPDSGTIRIAGSDSTHVPAHLRPVNTVFQSYALFPHLTVWENIAFGLKMKKVAPSEISVRVRAAMAMVEIEALAERRPQQLSGGQKQRVALARAVVNEPRVLLLDEPLAALDLKLRKQLQLELLNLQKRLGITFIYVTHDQEEALVLSDRIAVMQHGRIEQLADTRALYERPRTRFVSEFLGSCSLIPATVSARERAGALVATDLGPLRVAGEIPPREALTLAIRPEKIELAAIPSPTRENTVRARVEQMIYAGAETHYQLRAGSGMLLRAEVMNTGAGGFRPGCDVWMHLPAHALIILDD